MPRDANVEWPWSLRRCKSRLRAAEVLLTKAAESLEEHVRTVAYAEMRAEIEAAEEGAALLRAEGGAEDDGAVRWYTVVGFPPVSLPEGLEGLEASGAPVPGDASAVTYYPSRMVAATSPKEAAMHYLANTGGVAAKYQQCLVFPALSKGGQLAAKQVSVFSRLVPVVEVK